MMRYFIAWIFIVSCALCSAQFTYFNQITGNLYDQNSELSTNIEVKENSYVIWGGGVDSINSFVHIRKYDLDGNALNEHILYDENEYFYPGIVASMQWNPYTQQFVVMQGADVGATAEARMLTFDENLQLEDNLYFDNYNPYTYFLGFLIESDGYVVLGETASMDYTQGTFLMKLDFDGNVIWNEVLQPDVYQHIYRNWSVLKIDAGYLISGYGKSPGWDDQYYGLITFTNAAGETLDTVVMAESGMPLNGSIITTRTTQGDIVMGQGFGYELVDTDGNPHDFWNSIRYYKYDMETGDTSNVRNFFTDYQMHSAGGNKVLATSDGGIIMIGFYLGNFDYTSWILKLDSDLNEEWYREYTYQTCDNCTNLLYDIELAPDGGYIAAGYFANWDIDPRNATWLLKIDACGDLEWQGCAPVGVMEQEPNQFSVYPNPGSGRFTIEASENSQIVSWAVYNLSGQKVAQGNAPHFGQSMQINLNLSSGLYALELVQSDGKRENHKIQILR